MEGQVRRQEIIKLLEQAEKPLSGIYIGNTFGISRQVVVQDIALLRAEKHDILATARGYILNKDSQQIQSRVFLVKHDRNQVEEELNSIVDNGGRVRNVIIAHPVYGELVGDLMLRTRRDVKQFIEKLDRHSASTLMELTEGVHMHMVEANTKEELDSIESELSKKGMLVNSERE